MNSCDFEYKIIISIKYLHFLHYSKILSMLYTYRTTLYI